MHNNRLIRRTGAKEWKATLEDAIRRCNLKEITNILETETHRTMEIIQMVVRGLKQLTRQHVSWSIPICTWQLVPCTGWEQVLIAVTAAHTGDT
ncbi:unnamed protein product [Blepharisma stoltei]|uniref:Uncharacterized protein n=1 Tax=Blepharisma stoltei TaxID=1481888 RepID=A0AAU9IHE5_9CILI|nr:unnamed protein product [Blepharisma stoltei]